MMCLESDAIFFVEMFFLENPTPYTLLIIIIPPVYM